MGARVDLACGCRFIRHQMFPFSWGGDYHQHKPFVPTAYCQSESLCDGDAIIAAYCITYAAIIDLVSVEVLDPLAAALEDRFA